MLQSSAMQRTDEHHLVAILQDIVAFAFEFPIAVVDQHEDAWSSVMCKSNKHICQHSTCQYPAALHCFELCLHRVAVYEEFFSFCDQVLANVTNQEADIGLITSCIGSRYCQRVLLLVWRCQQKLGASSKLDADLDCVLRHSRWHTLFAWRTYAFGAWKCYAPAVIKG